MSSRRLALAGAVAGLAVLAAAVGPVRAQGGAPLPSLDALPATATAAPEGCPTTTDDNTVASADQLLAYLTTGAPLPEDDLFAGLRP